MAATAVPHSRESIRDYIVDPSNGIILDARERKSPDGTMEYVEGAAFRAPGRETLRQRHILIPALFREAKWFDLCADELAKIAEAFCGVVRAVRPSRCWPAAMLPLSTFWNTWRLGLES